MKHEKNIELKLWIALLVLIAVAVICMSCTPKNQLTRPHQRDFYIHKVYRDKVVVLKFGHPLSDTIYKDALMELRRPKWDTVARSNKGYLIDEVTRNVLIRN
jgi:hypothetical protein